MKSLFAVLKSRKYVVLISYVLLSLFFFCSCSQNEKKKTDNMMVYFNDQNTYYDLLNPTEVYKLPEKVAEISGLSLSKKEDNLLFLDDESGKVYSYDLKKKKIKSSMRFWKNGDFEGIELVGERVYALKSNGDLISFEIGKTRIKKGKREGTALSSKNDTEGLGYDAENDVLLIACKEKGDIKGKRVLGRVVYAYDYHKGEVLEKPVIQVRWEQIRQFLKYKGGESFLKDSQKFRPSGIAVHPLERNYYVLSTTGKSIIIFNRSGEIVGYYTIPRKILEQPEGICFNSQGDLYISSEGDERKARIVKFDLKLK